MKGKLVSVLLDENGKCVELHDVKTIDSKEYAKYKNEAYQHKEKDIEFKNFVLGIADSCEKHSHKFELHELCLAKSLFDNYVDRGLIDSDEKFEKDFADFLFNGKDFDLLSAPSEFKKILERLGK